jgi:SAM-dependent methyltransferase
MPPNVAHASDSIMKDRWRKAQNAEKEFWESMIYNQEAIIKTVSEIHAAARFLENNVQNAHIIPGPYLEVGIGPLGIGCMHFLRSSAGRKLYGIDPLFQLSDFSSCQSFFKSMLQFFQCNYIHIPASGENLCFRNENFALAACYNVLNHAENSEAVLLELHRVLKPQGFLLVGCDTLSLLSIARNHILGIYDIFHPHKFTSRYLEKLITGCGFRLIATNHKRYDTINYLCGRAFRRIVIAQKAD